VTQQINSVFITISFSSFAFSRDYSASNPIRKHSANISTRRSAAYQLRQNVLDDITRNIHRRAGLTSNRTASPRDVRLVSPRLLRRH
jgi:hypothetical protein